MHRLLLVVALLFALPALAEKPATPTVDGAPEVGGHEEHEGHAPAEVGGHDDEQAPMTPAQDEVGGHEERGEGHGEHALVDAPAPAYKPHPGEVGRTMLLVLLVLGAGFGLADAVKKQLG